MIYGKVLILAASFVFGFSTGFYVQKTISDPKIASLREEMQTIIAQMNEERAAAERRARETEQRLRAAVETAEKELKEEREKVHELEQKIAEQNARIRDLIRERNGLRDELLTYAAGPATGDTLAACRERAGTLAKVVADGADLLAEGAGLLAEVAADHDERAAEVEALLNAWPRAE